MSAVRSRSGTNAAHPATATTPTRAAEREYESAITLIMSVIAGIVSARRTVGLAGRVAAHSAGASPRAAATPMAFQ